MSECKHDWVDVSTHCDEDVRVFLCILCKATKNEEKRPAQSVLLRDDGQGFKPVAEIREFRIPGSYMGASWRGTTRADLENGQIGVSFDLSNGDVYRLSLDIESAVKLSSSIIEYIPRVNFSAEDLVTIAQLVQSCNESTRLAHEEAKRLGIRFDGKED